MPSKVPSRMVLVSCLCLYQVAYVFVFAFFLAWRMAFHPHYRRGFGQRFGLVPKSKPGRSVIWIHGVSVGEVKAAGTLIRQLQEIHPHADMVISSTTPTGHDLAGQLYSEPRVIYFPLDLGPCPGLALRRVRPSCVLLMELEVWPNFLQAAWGQGIPVAVINGRISEQSFRRYRLVRAVLPQLDLIELYCMQDEVYRQRLLDLRVDPDCTRVTGNMKYDNVMLKEPPVLSHRLRQWLAPDDRLVFVCGSTHGEEEVWLATAASKAQARLRKDLRIVLVPRHPERAAGVRDALRAMGMAVVLWSKRREPLTPLEDDAVLIVDTIGQLEAFYGACDVAFVGGSLVPRGGQNMMEPAALGKAVVFGPHVHNFRKDVQQLLAAEAASQVGSLEDLAQQLQILFSDAALRTSLGERAVALIRRNQGSTDRTLRTLAPVLRRLTVATRSAEQDGEADQQNPEQGEDHGSGLHGPATGCGGGAH